MPYMHSPLSWIRRSRRLTVSGFSSLAFLSLLNAQNSDESDSEETVFTLSAFEVNASDDVGYRAGNTVSGSRLNSSLSDLAASITAFTPEFLEDFNITGLEDLTSYASSMATDMQDTSADANSTFLGGADFYDTRVRVRGLSASVSRDFFRTYIPVDSYNTSRTELSQGPNSILFGIGSPGGLVNVVTKRAILAEDSASFRYQFGSWDANRLTLDLNQVLLEDKLAIRFNGLIDDRNGWRTHDFSEGQRGTLSVRARLADRSVLNAFAEFGDFESHISRPMTVYDNLKLWQESGSPVANPLTWSAVSDRNRGIDRFAPFRNTYVSASEDVPGFLIATQNNATGRILQSTYDNFNVSAASRAGLTLASEDLVPVELDLYGPDSKRSSEFNRLGLVFEQRLGEDLYLELAYNRERTSQQAWTPAVGNFTLQGDPNLLIANRGAASTGDLEENPYAGEVFIESRWGGSEGEVDTDMLRASLSWELDLERFGRHQLGVVAEHAETTSWRTSQYEILVDENGTPVSNVNVPENGNNWIWRRNYITLGDYDTYVAAGQSDSFSVQLNGTSYMSRIITGNLGGGYVEQTGDSLVAATQSFFFDNSLVVTAGIRQDNTLNEVRASDRYEADDPEVRSGERILNEIKYGDEIGSSYEFNPLTGTIGAVYHLNDTFSVFYNKASNTESPRTNFVILPDETLPEAVDGDTNDFGFMLKLMEGKVFMRATRYQSKQINSVGGSFAIPLNSTDSNIVDPTTRILDTLLANGIISDSEYTEHLIGDQSNLSGRSDINNSGYELATYFNFSKNFTSVLNYSYTDSDRSSVVPEFEGWYDREYQFWFSDPAARNLIDPESGATLSVVADNIVDQIESAREWYGLGYGVKPHALNLSARYRVSENALKGLSFGGSVRWESKPKLGREFEGRDENGQRILGDFIYGDEALKVDAFVSYRRKVDWFPKQSSLILQLNVTNLTDEDTLVPLRYNQGESGYYRVLLREPRKVRMTVGMDF